MANSLFQSGARPKAGKLAGSAMVASIEAFDWSTTPLGPLGEWSETMRAAARVMLASAAPMVLLAGPHGVLVYNDGYAEFAGAKHPSILGRPAADAFPEIADFNRDIIARAYRGETLSLEDQEFALSRDGETEPVWMDLEYTPLIGAGGEPEGMLATVYETTARVKTQLALRASEERLVVALSAAGTVGTWDWDVETRRLSGDARFAAIYGVDPADAADGLPTEAYEDAVHPDDRASVHGRLAKALEGDGRYFVEYRLKHGDEPSRWVQATGRVVADAGGMPTRMSGVVIDISERKRHETELATSEAKFRALADTMPQMVWSTLPDGFHDYYNARWYEFTGVPAGSTDGEGWNGMFHPDDQDRAWTRWRHSLETGEPYDIEYRLRHHSGEYRWTLGRALPITDAKGRIIRWFGTCTDIHDAKVAAEEREVVAQELSHRIKNIFSVLNGIIALSARSNPVAKPFADQLKQRIFAMGQAHDFVRPHSAASRPQEKQSSLRALALKLLSPFAGAGSETFRFTGEDAVIDEAAATPLALLFHELATNAAKYGALAAGSGNVVLAGSHDGEAYVLDWKETGGAPVAKPSREGFGSRLMALSVQGQLGGSVERFWESDGLRIAVRLPHAALRRSGKLKTVPDASPLRMTA
jgi:PAS domain S-box-containing protein